MVVSDYFVCDDIVLNQDYVRCRLCIVEWFLWFMEYMGLKFYWNWIIYLKVFCDIKLLNIDYVIFWIDYEYGQFILIDEFYSNVFDVDVCVEWFEYIGWCIEKSMWLGMYSFYDCDFFVGVDGRFGYDFDVLMVKINVMFVFIVSEFWIGDFMLLWEIFLSLMVKMCWDECCVRCKGMIYFLVSKNIVLYVYNLGCCDWCLVGEFGIEGYMEVGWIIKIVM